MTRDANIHVRTARRGKRRLDVEAAAADMTTSELVRSGMDSLIAYADACDVDLPEAIRTLRLVAAELERAADG